MENSVIQDEKSKNIDRRSRSRSRERRSHSRPRRYSRSRSGSPYRGGRFGSRGVNSRNNRFNRRSPYRRNFRDRFRRSPSNSRDRFDRKDNRRRYDSRRSKSNSPSSNARYGQQQQQQQHHQMNYQSDAYNSYMPAAPQAPQFSGQMVPFNSYDFQANYPPPAPSFSINPTAMHSNIAIPAPPGMGDSWVPPLQQQMQAPGETKEERLKREAAIAEEKKRQREGLKMQRDQYIMRAEKMKRELKALKQQKSDLLDGLNKRSPSPKTNEFIKENDNLQSQISSKLTEVLNVIDMLSKIIKKDSEEDDEEKKPTKRPSRKSESDDSSPERIKNEILKSLDRKRAKENEEKKPVVEKEKEKEKINYILYDPELHWCKHCQEFPKTAKDYLSHLHSKEHLEKIANRSTDAPWRASFQKKNDLPSYPDAPTKRAPIKGLQFFEPATAWYCKLCEVFMGDSWCVSLHLKSETHFERYNKLLEREPKFEEKWIEARKKALELTGKAPSNLSENQSNSASSTVVDDKQSADKKLSDKKSKKKKNKKDSKKKRKHGKKRKRDSSSSSSSDSDDNSDSSSESDTSSKKNDSDQMDSKNSIRVAMRNLLKKTTPTESDGKWTKVAIDSNKPQVPPAPTISQHAAKEIKNDEKLLGQWNAVEPVISQEEKRMLENLKGKLKQKQEPVATTRKVEKEKSRSRSKDRVRSDRNYRGRRSRSRSRSKSRGRRTRSRSRSRDRRFSRRNRSRSRSRSRSRGSRSRYTRPVGVTFPSEPRLPPLKEEKQPARSYTTTVKKGDSSSSSALAKKMPFIGKMPVFKKQLTEKKIEEPQPQEEKQVEEKPAKKEKTEEVKRDEEKWDELMPDPLQFSAMMNTANAQQQHQQAIMNEEPDAPPGLDAELDSEFIPKPISDAPIPRQGPLPKDFQQTLDLLFDDGGKPKQVVIEPVVPETPPEPMQIVTNDGPQMIMPEELSQHGMLYGNYYQQNSGDIHPVPPPPPISVTFNNHPMKNENNNTNNAEDDDDENDKKDDRNDSTETNDSADDKINKNQEEMEDLAMLGIDVNDVGCGGLW